MKIGAPLAFSFLLSLGACANDGISSPDAEDAIAVPGGKADDLSISPCTVGAILDRLNDPATTAESLRADGLHTRAANNLMNERLGPDLQAGTEDDVFFADIVQVDDVSWVGPVAMRQLGEMVTCDTDGSGAGETDVIFSPQPFERSHLARAVELIDGAERSLDVAMYSMSNSAVIAALGRAAERGVSIRMLFHPALSERRDPEGTRSGRLEEAGIDVRYINKIMHHKFVIVDGPRGEADRTDGILMTGSGNWSNSAGDRYDENTLILEGQAELLFRYEREFNLLWNNSRDFELVPFEQLEVPTVGEGVITAVDAEDVEAYFTSANFRTTNSTRYGRGFSVERGRDEVADQLVALIASAESSIRIASGHLRSRPVAEALIAAVEANPSLDVRIYTDAQEFISEYSHNLQVNRRADCLEEAEGREAATQRCYDRGFLYGFQFDRAGIDIRFKYYSYRWHYSYAVQMHHKYFVIDDSVLVTGSYNLSDNAEHATMENIVILKGPRYAETVQRYADNFDALWETGRDAREGELTLYEELLDDVQTGTDEFPIVFESMALNWEEIDVLKRAMRSACPAINSQEMRRNPQRFRVCRPE